MLLLNTRLYILDVGNKNKIPKLFDCCLGVSFN